MQVCLATANYPGIPYKTNFFFNGTIMPDHVDNAAIQAQSIDKNATFKSELKAFRAFIYFYCKKKLKLQIRKFTSH